MTRVTSWFYATTSVIGFTTAVASLWTLSLLVICWRQSVKQTDRLMLRFLQGSSTASDYQKTRHPYRLGR